MHDLQIADPGTCRRGVAETNQGLVLKITSLAPTAQLGGLGYKSTIIAKDLITRADTGWTKTPIVHSISSKAFLFIFWETKRNKEIQKEISIPKEPYFYARTRSNKPFLLDRTTNIILRQRYYIAMRPQKGLGSMLKAPEDKTSV